MTDHYIIDKNGIISEASLIEWAEWFETNPPERIIGKDSVKFGESELRISTVFLGLDHRFSGEGDPILFETMLFDESDSGEELYMERYTTFDAALEKHNHIKSVLNDVNKEIKSQGISPEEWLKAFLSKQKIQQSEDPQVQK